jgi:hypothetical protein
MTQNWVAADSLVTPVPGLRLSDSRTWTVEGIFPEGFKARGKFSYSRSPGFENNLITGPGDSLVMLYREGAGHPWRGTAFVKQGSWFAGTLTVDTLRRGEYTFAVWNKTMLGIKETGTGSRERMELWPNPAQKRVNVTIETEKGAFFTVFDSLGKQLTSIPLSAGTNHLSWENSTNRPGIFFFRYSGISGNLIESKKVVFN